MTERLTEAELAVVESDARAFMVADGVDDITHALRVTMLVAEVRRLRGLIEPFAGNCGYDTACIGCGDSSGDRHAPGCPWLPLQAEAEAIRAERSTPGVEHGPATPDGNKGS